MVKAALLALALPALLAGCLAGAPPVHVATGQIDGAVVDQLLRPFSNQTVYLSQLGWKDSTSALGGFTFRNVPVGSYMLLAARPGTQGAAVSVQVDEGRITKTILQMMPTPTRQPHMVVVTPHEAFENTAQQNQPCGSCSWTVTLDGDERPSDIFVEARWDGSLLAQDNIRFKITDDQGDILYQNAPETHPFATGIDGRDLPAGVHEIHLQAWFGPDFTPRANFRMQTFMTLCYGCLRDQLPPP